MGIAREMPRFYWFGSPLMWAMDYVDPIRAHWWTSPAVQLVVQHRTITVVGWSVISIWLIYLQSKTDKPEPDVSPIWITILLTALAFVTVRICCVDLLCRPRFRVRYLLLTPFHPMLCCCGV